MKDIHRNSFTLAPVLVLSSIGLTGQATQIPSQRLINADELAKLLQSSAGDKPLVIHVGFHVLYLQAHIPGAEYLGPASDPNALQKLRARVDPLPRNKFIVIYCGCCPWSHCPSIQPAHDALQGMGFTNFRVLYIPDNFGTDWRDKGYPTAKGE